MLGKSLSRTGRGFLFDNYYPFGVVFAGKQLDGRMRQSGATYYPQPHVLAVGALLLAKATLCRTFEILILSNSS